jgi:hypothetical protein
MMVASTKVPYHHDACFGQPAIDGLGVRLENGNFPTLSVLSLTSDFVPLSANP